MRTRNACSEPDCGSAAFGRGLCSLHYQKALYHGTLPAFREHVCARCGKTYTDRKWNSVYCSRLCMERGRYAKRIEGRVRPVHSCVQCAKSLDDKRVDARFCSAACGSDYRNSHVRADRLAAKLANPKPCAHCAAPLPPHRKRFCSDKCHAAHRRPEKYGLSRDELAALLAQHDVCAICQTADWGRKGPVVDHDHATGRVRGVLCGNCNVALGNFRDDPGRLRAALTYLGQPME